MASTGLDKSLYSRIARPPLTSQHSSSVPSTPHQIPQDLRFRTRSPSPDHTLPVPAIQSSLPDAVAGPTSHPKTNVVVCKFESGAEFRKRRIPYKDGGNEILPDPESEPKTALSADEEKKLTSDMTELYQRLLPSEESEDRRARLVDKVKDILAKAWPDDDIQINVFGSSGNLLSTTDSDVDICLTTSLKKLESMHSLATVLHDHGMEKVVCRASAKVPIVKMWDPELQLACDLNVNNPIALENTRMIKTYVQIDDRVRPLAKIIKYWTKRRILNDAAYGGTISSYTWICMILGFLQNRTPPILPSLQLLPDDFRTTSPHGDVSPFADKLDRLQGHGAPNNETLGQLLFAFFRHYAYEVNYQETIISVREGRLMSRSEKGWEVSNYHEREARSRLCVEEPFNTTRNLGNSADDYAFSGIHEEIRRAFDLISRGNLDEFCAQFVFPPEEKPVFQRPVAKPKPTLTRSASQSSRTNLHQANNARSSNGSNTGPRPSRNPSTQRSNSRRASSGAMYANARYTAMNSPSTTASMGSADYFASPAMSTDQLHQQLYKQYQVLQAKQEALRNQLYQQQQAQMQWQQVSPTVTRQRQFANSVSSPRTLDGAGQSSAIINGVLYHYPTGHGQQIGAQVVGPPVTGTHVTRHRHSVGPGSAPAVRSQSQPGRSYSTSISAQNMPGGYELSGAQGLPYMVARPMQGYNQAHVVGDGLNLPLLQQAERPMPKEYVGYYLGQPSQLVTQLPNGSVIQTPILREIPRRPRRSSPERPTGYGSRSRRSSPSPPKVPRERTPTGYVSSSTSVPPTPTFASRAMLPIDTRDPVIVNGSTSSQVSTPIATRADYGWNLNGPTSTPSSLHNNIIDSTARSTPSNSFSEHESLSIGTRSRRSTNYSPASGLSEMQQSHAERASSAIDDVSDTGTRDIAEPVVTPKHELARAELGLIDTSANTPDERELVSAMLSPVAEMRTPSPTRSLGQRTPRPQLQGLAWMANGSENERLRESEHVPGVSVKSAGPWQQVRKGNKAVSDGAAKDGPLDEEERKGG